MKYAKPLLAPHPFAVAGAWLTRRRAVVIAALSVAAIGLALGWGWLAALGLAPILVSILPCLAMCALGVCMQTMGGKSCSAEAGLGSGSPQPDSLSGSGSSFTSPRARPEPITIEGTYREIPLDSAHDADGPAVPLHRDKL